MNKKERLIKAYNYLRGEGIVSTQQDIADALKASRTNVSSALKGDERVLTDKFLLRFAKAFEGIISGTWLLTGEGDMLVQHQEPTPVTHDDPNTELIKLQKKQISMLEQQIADLRESLADKNEIIYLLRQKISNLTSDNSLIRDFPIGAAEIHKTEIQ